MTTKTEDLRESLSVARELTRRGVDRQKAIWEATARHTLDDDLGQFDDSRMFEYDVDDATRNRLVAHIRKDVAMIYYAAVATFEESRMSRIWSFLSFIVLVTILYRVW